MTAIKPEETSIAGGQPIELYRFIHGDLSLQYTSGAERVEIVSGGVALTFQPDTISRENIRPGSSGSIEACVIRVDKDNGVAKLYEGAPPEVPVSVIVSRLHASDLSRADVILRGQVSEVHFTGSECELTCTMDAWLEKELPNGMNQYYCNWAVFDHNCGLNRANYAATIMIDHVEGNTAIYSSDLNAYEDGYFDGGRLYDGKGNVRMIEKQAGGVLWLKYPFIEPPRNEVTILPGCDQLFTTCARRYHNTIHFGGVPYCPPTDPEKNPTGKGAYWVDSLVIQRDTDGYVGTIEI